MRFHISPFGYIPNRYVLAGFFALVAILVIFYRLIIDLVIVCLFGLAGWWIGSLLDDPLFLTRWKYRLKNVFSRKS